MQAVLIAMHACQCELLLGWTISSKGPTPESCAHGLWGFDGLKYTTSAAASGWTHERSVYHSITFYTSFV